MSHKIEIKKGDRYGSLVIINEIFTKPGRRHFLCQCDCGNKSEVIISNLTMGLTQSCGCMQYKNRPHKHRLIRHSLYKVWQCMKLRCYDKNNSQYYNYGARGIFICDEWRNSFICFYTWAISAGWKDGLWIERIDNNGNYNAENCTFETRLRQANNKRTNQHLEIDGKIMSLTDVCRKYDVLDSYQAIWQRLKSTKLPIKEVIQFYI